MSFFITKLLKFLIITLFLSFSLTPKAYPSDTISSFPVISPEAIEDLYKMVHALTNMGNSVTNAADEIELFFHNLNLPIISPLEVLLYGGAILGASAGIITLSALLTQDFYKGGKYVLGIPFQCLKKICQEKSILPTVNEDNYQALQTFLANTNLEDNDE